MQEELEQKSVAISIKAGKLTANLLKKALEKALTEMTKSQKNPKIYKGKQSVKHLVRQGAGVSNIEITDGNIKSFERVARALVQQGHYKLKILNTIDFGCSMHYNPFHYLHSETDIKPDRQTGEQHGQSLSGGCSRPAGAISGTLGRG